MIKPFSAVLAIALLSHFVHAADSETIWNEASASYDRGDYTGAIERYSKLVERGEISPQLYYNLGNSYFKADHLGPAIWAYRRALRLDPGMEQARVNLDYVREFNVDKIETRRAGFTADIWNHLSGLMSANGYILAFAASWWVLGILVSFMVLRPRNASWPQYLLILCLVLAIFTSSATVTRLKHDRYSRWGVLVAPAVDIREGPAEDFARIEVGHEGLEFRILGEREKNFLIELENGLKGWISSEAALEI